MSLLFWKYRELGNQQTAQELNDFVWAQDLVVLFLSKTWLDKVGLVVIRDSLQFGGYHGVSKISRGGGLVLFCKNDLGVHVESSSTNHIDALINKGKEDMWRFTGFYGALKTHLRMELWNLLRDLHQ